MAVSGDHDRYRQLHILHVTLSSGVSGTLNSANNADDALREEYPERKIYIIDSLCASSGYGLLMDKAAHLRDDGMTIDQLASWINDNKPKVNHFSTDLNACFVADPTFLSI